MKSFIPSDTTNEISCKWEAFPKSELREIIYLFMQRNTWMCYLYLFIIHITGFQSTLSSQQWCSVSLQVTNAYLCERLFITHIWHCFPTNLYAISHELKILPAVEKLKPATVSLTWVITVGSETILTVLNGSISSILDNVQVHYWNLCLHKVEQSCLIDPNFSQVFRVNHWLCQASTKV